MAAKDTEKTIEDFIGLAAKEIDVIAKRVQFEPAAQDTVVQILQGLSAQAQKSISDLSQTFQSLSEKDREAISSTLEKSGAVNTMGLLSRLLKLGDATDPCFLAHEASKALYAAANIVGLFPDFPGKVALGSAFEGAALLFDIVSQVCLQGESEIAQQNLDAMEQEVKVIEQKLDFIMDRPPGVAIPPVPKDDVPTSLSILRKLLEVTKKFFKFEGSFTPTFQKDKQLIRIGPPAVPHPATPILVSGFIDLGGMQDNDVVTITTKVLEDNPVPHYVIWRVKTYTGHQSSGLKHTANFADLEEVPGDGFEVLICQGASRSNFDPTSLLTIPYQFLVETTVLPQFVVS